eukprot:scaffold2610_cov301-Prasinococcus_capsulatus_cf.AAC.7
MTNSCSLPHPAAGSVQESTAVAGQTGEFAEQHPPRVQRDQNLPALPVVFAVLRPKTEAQEVAALRVLVGPVDLLPLDVPGLTIEDVAVAAADACECPHKCEQTRARARLWLDLVPF